MYTIQMILWTNFIYFLVSDMQTSPPPLKKSRFNFLVKNDTQCSETYEKSIFRFLQLYFLSHDRLCSQFSSVFTVQNEKKMSLTMSNVLKRIFEIMSFFVWFLVFELWSILYFTFVMYSGLRRFQIFFISRGPCLSKPSVFVEVFAPPHPQHHWLASGSGSQDSRSPQYIVNHCWIQNRPHLTNKYKYINTNTIYWQELNKLRKLKIAQKNSMT